MKRSAVIDVVGLSPRLLGRHMPRLTGWIRQGASAAVRPPLPAVTCSVQATYLTGRMPAEHGIVGNGWYFRDRCEIAFWRQSNRLVGAHKVWERARKAAPELRCAVLFWWYNMYSSADWAVTPRPMYPADGRKIPDVHSRPALLRHELQRELGRFPLFQFWGPATDLRASQWIADAARILELRHAPELSLVYLPHLDYCLQRHGPELPAIAGDLEALDRLCADLIRFYETRDVEVIVTSEYGITPVDRPVHANRALRRAGLIEVRDELGLELLDPGASAAFAVADHQIAHVYVNDHARLGQVRAVLERLDGVGEILDRDGQRRAGLGHPRSGDLVLIADERSWFTYYYWLDDRRAPDFARTVDIHRKPGYDPVELFIDPALRAPGLRIGWKLLRKRLGFRTLMDVVPLDASLVRGSHGRVPANLVDAPLVASRRRDLIADGEVMPATAMAGLILDHLGVGREIRSSPAASASPSA